MTDRLIRVLLIDGQVEDSRWVQELLAELEEGRFGGGWMHGLEVFHLDRLGDALTLLEDSEGKEQFDVVLLNPTLPDSFGLNTYLRVRSRVRETPVVILAEQDDPDLAISMVRAGAQDFLAKTQLDSLPLARALRLAVERNRILRDLRALTWGDELTGLMNRSGFEMMAERDMAAARRLGVEMAVAVVELSGLEEVGFAYGKDERELALIEAADVVKSVFPRASCMARVSQNRFAVSLLPKDEEEVEGVMEDLRKRFQQVARKANRSPLRIKERIHWLGDEAAESPAAAVESLCENIGDRQRGAMATAAGEKGPGRGNPQLVNSIGRNV
ncbi:MAG: diguanylate cyclase [Bryobacterales bacterium]|nr:diguanylate cyclase [Bryobacterales bacterium]